MTPQRQHLDNTFLLLQNFFLRKQLSPQAVITIFLLIIICARILLDSEYGIVPSPIKVRGGGYSTDVTSRLAPPGTAYRGTPWHNERTVAVETLGETKFARCDVHTVLSEDGASTINDWIFLEETPAVNVIVQTLEQKYAVFRQKKYAIPGETLSPVGGFIDVNESPLTAAKREVLEELGMGSRRTLRMVRQGLKGYNNGRGGSPSKTLDRETVAKIIVDGADPPQLDKYGLLDGVSRKVPSLEYDVDWIYLGKYRTAANRGGGFVYSYLLKNAVPLIPGGGTINYEGMGDSENQEILLLEENAVVTALSEGRFKEIKWAATFALAMMHVRNGMPACCGKNEDIVGVIG